MNPGIYSIHAAVLPGVYLSPGFITDKYNTF